MTYKLEDSRGYKTILLDPPFLGIELDIASDFSVSDLVELEEEAQIPDVLVRLIQDWNIEYQDEPLPITVESFDLPLFSNTLLKMIIEKVFACVKEYTGDDILFLSRNGEQTRENIQED